MWKSLKSLSILCLSLLSVQAWARKPSYEQWLQEFKREAEKEGISKKALAEMDRVELLPRVLELDRKQPESTMTFEDYQRRVLKPERFTEGRRLFALHKEDIEKAATKYGVEPEVIAALWGVETHFGTVMGDFSIISALTTLAYDGRRVKLFRAQLKDALRIIDRGDIDADSMKGSWAGAMGNCQFMPSTFLAYAVDMDNDGRRDLWKSLPDVFGSAAHYLSKAGWKKGRGWGEPVTLPDGFDETLLGRKVTKSRSDWKALGVKKADGGELQDGDAMVSLVKPGGKSTQVFLVQGNYHVLLRWNNSEFFATVVSLLAEGIAKAETATAAPQAP